MSQLFADRRRRNLRIVLFVIILATLPFYCIGFWLWGSAQQGGSRSASPTPDGLITSTVQDDATATRTLEASITPLPNPLTPTGFVPPTAILPPTITNPPPFIPSATPAPTLTPFPTITPFPTNTFLPPPTFTPFPTITPFPTNTPSLTPTTTETPTTIPIDIGGGDSGVPPGG